MSKGTVVIVGKGGTGKTTELIKKSAESGIYILVANRRRAEILVEHAKAMKLYIPFPVTLQEWLRSDNRFHGSSICRDGLLIDDIDSVIEELFRPIDIKAVTLRTPCVITNLDQPDFDVVEVVRCKDCKHYTEEMIGDDLEGICKSVSGMLNPAPDFYCSYGERREECTEQTI
jgi:hypothetical protein